MVDGALFDDTGAQRHDRAPDPVDEDRSTPRGTTSAAESPGRRARREGGGTRSTADYADFGSDGASPARRNGQVRPVSGSAPDGAEDRRGGHRRIDADPDTADPAGRRAVPGPDPAPADTGQRVTGADAFRRARSTSEDDRPADQDRSQPVGDRPADVEPDIDKLGLADLLAGALAAYRGL